ncbi:hypothetical protein B0T26DRAFT_683171 [Lasiosphaeria miniovina]|uniref:Uncharacterized protein n=1 Tax=Lasiosphaeria miniovina TaxID=1954250 RepID=A0AA40BFD6_9PEZI|nr:uncharacterized protein B0T26DRAFT_683171 [Lasiosphaeria miniovina]KAK0733228.1 hypothetical protein B0T26DRAFT_683171 [Lasiosphaeria miniovina]
MASPGLSQEDKDFRDAFNKIYDHAKSQMDKYALPNEVQRKTKELLQARFQDEAVIKAQTPLIVKGYVASGDYKAATAKLMKLYVSPPTSESGGSSSGLSDTSATAEFTFKYRDLPEFQGNAAVAAYILQKELNILGSSYGNDLVKETVRIMKHDAKPKSPPSTVAKGEAAAEWVHKNDTEYKAHVENSYKQAVVNLKNQGTQIGERHLAAFGGLGDLGTLKK